MTTAETFSEIWEEFAAPSAKVFRQALHARGIQARVSDIKEFISSKSERQVLQPGYRFTGKVVAFDKEDRWAADVISYVSRPAWKDGKEYKYILIAQDMFSRFIRTIPLVSVADTTTAFAQMLRSATPRSLSVDKGSEFRAGKFQELCAKNDIRLEFKATQDRNGPTARLDSAIGHFKRLSAKMREVRKERDLARRR